MSDEAQTGNVQCKEPGYVVLCCSIMPYCTHELFHVYIFTVNCLISFINVSTIPRLILRSFVVWV
jgi:hypothetical protein